MPDATLVHSERGIILLKNGGRPSCILDPKSLFSNKLNALRLLDIPESDNELT